MKSLTQQKNWFLYLCIIIFYTVGTIGISIAKFKSYLLSMSWVILFFSFLAILYTRRNKKTSFYFFLILCYLFSMLTEIIGVRTGLLFGLYEYGDNLGSKVFEVPLIIGLNWVVLIVSSASFFYKINSRLWRIVLASLLMVLIDVIMEPVAVSMNFWNWQGDIPVYNFICWFVISLIMHFAYDIMNLVETNNFPRFLFCILALFFIILNFI